MARRLRSTDATPGRPWEADRGVLAGVAAAVTIGTVAAAIIGFGAVGSPEYPSQTYDGVFHLNAVARILETGDASSFHLYRLTHPGDGIEFYPAAWHAFVALVVQLTGASVATATSAVWIATSGTLFAAGSAWLALVAIPGARNRVLVGVAGALTATITATAPYVLLRWGVLYPTGLAYALLPVGLALTVLVLRSLPSRRSVLPGALLATWVVAEIFAHPRSLASYGLLVFPLALMAVVTWAHRGVTDPARRRRTLAILVCGAVAAAFTLAVAAAAVLIYFRAGERPISDRLNGGPATARQSLAESLLQGLFLAPPSGPGESMLPITLLVAAVVLAGVVLAAMGPRTRWLALAYLLVAVLYAFAAGSNSDLAKILTGFWYKDKFRLIALLGVIAAPLVALVVTRIDTLLHDRRGPGRLSGLAAPALLTLVVLSAWFGPTLTAMRSAIALDYTLEEEKDGRLLDADEYELLRRLPELTEPGAVIVGNPWNGSTLSLAVGERESLFPHMTGQWDADRVTVATRLDTAATDPAVCDALQRLDARYLLASDGLLWNGDPQAEFFAGIDRAAGADGFEEIASSGSTRLYRIAACAG